MLLNILQYIRKVPYEHYPAQNVHSAKVEKIFSKGTLCLMEAHCLIRVWTTHKTRATHFRRLQLKWDDVTEIKLIGWCLKQISTVIFLCVCFSHIHMSIKLIKHHTVQTFTHPKCKWGPVYGWREMWSQLGWGNTFIPPKGLQLPWPKQIRSWTHLDYGKCKHQVPQNHRGGRTLTLMSRANILFNIVYWQKNLLGVLSRA